MKRMPYIGRFAPTPSGYLHFGSLVAALASYLDARSCGGRWLLRMEDLDPPREIPGAQEEILRSLQAFGFEWDGTMVRQSERQSAYEEVLQRLLEQGLAYACTCSRKQLAEHGGIYPGSYAQHLGRDVGDFVIRRRDGLYAYQLAVVLDDAWQGVTDVVRGADLLDSTPRQLYLQELLGLPQPRYLHVPLIIQADGNKLGKSYRSPALAADQAATQLCRALRALGQQPPAELINATPKEILCWAVKHWQDERIPRTLSLEETGLL